MKEMNRRAFLTLTGAALAMMALAACGADDVPAVPPAPAAPTSKEAELVAAINKVWKKKFDAGQVTHEQLTLNQEAQGAIKIQGGIFENAQTPVRTLMWGDRIFEKCGIGRDEGGDGGKTLEIRGKRRLSARDRGANYQQS